MGLSCIVNPTNTSAFIPTSCLFQYFFIISESLPHYCHGMVGDPPYFIGATVYHHGRTFKLVGRPEARSRRQTISRQRRSLSVWFIDCYRCGLCCFSLVDRWCTWLFLTCNLRSSFFVQCSFIIVISNSSILTDVVDIAWGRNNCFLVFDTYRIRSTANKHHRIFRPCRFHCL